jgi:hypothetical protein
MPHRPRIDENEKCEKPSSISIYVDGSRLRKISQTVIANDNMFLSPPRTDVNVEISLL